MFDARASSPGFRKFLPALLLVFAIALVYANALGNGFVWDDRNVVMNNPALRRVFPLSRFFVGEGLLRQRPMLSLSFALDYRLWGLNPFGFHLANLLLHALACLGVFLLGLHLSGSARAAWIASLIFAIHPIHAEAVAALLGRSDLLAAVSGIWGFLSYAASRRSSGRISILLFALALLCFGVSCLFKETGIVLVGWIILYEWFRAGKASLRTSLLRVLPFALIAVSYLAFLRFTAGPALAKTGWWGASFSNNLLMSAQVFGEYLRLLFFPLRLSPWYVIPVPRGLWDLKILLGLSALVVILGGFIICLVRRSLLGFLFGWYLICFLPLSNLVPIPGSMMAERWFYAGSAAFCIGVVLAWERLMALLRPRFRRLAFTLGVLALLLLGLRSAAWNGIWRTDFTLFREILREHPLLPRAHLWLADAYNGADSIAQAEHRYRTALALAPDDPEIHADLGVLYRKQGRFGEAVQEFRTALRLGGEHPQPRMNLGITYEQLGRFPEALDEYQSALRLGTEKSRAYFRRGECFRQLGDTVRARQAYSQALSLDPTFSEARAHLRSLGK